MPSMLLSREAVSEADRPGAQDRAQRQQHAMARVCAINNANVTRDYGTHTQDFSRPVRGLAADELADVLNLVGVVYAPPVRPRTRAEAPAVPFDRRRSAQACAPGPT